MPAAQQGTSAAPIISLFMMLKEGSDVEVQLIADLKRRFRGRLVGFDEYMNLVLEDTVEVLDGEANALGRLLLKGDNIALVSRLKPSIYSLQLMEGGSLEIKGDPKGVVLYAPIDTPTGTILQPVVVRFADRVYPAIVEPYSIPKIEMPITKTRQTEVVRTPGFVSRDALDDGYHWHKYGQKLLRGAVFPTCYYRCAFIGCKARRQVSRDPITLKPISTYIGTHSHPRPQLISTEANTLSDFIRVVVRGQLFIWEDHGVGNLLCDGCGDAPFVDSYLQLAREIGEKAEADETPTITPESAEANTNRQLAVRVNEFVNPNEDGFLWSKYGQKKATGPGGVCKKYLRCPSPGCNVRKVIQFAAASAKGELGLPGVDTLVIYKGVHNHPPNPVMMEPF